MVLMLSFLFLPLLMTATESAGDRKQVRIETTLGTMVVELYDETPEHRDNFLKLAEEGCYDGLLWHRVIKGFMAQGGDPKSKGAESGMRLGNGGPGYTVPAEIDPQFVHVKGALAAAARVAASTRRAATSSAAASAASVWRSAASHSAARLA